MLRYLVDLADDRHLAPTHGRVGPGPPGDSLIQQRILAEIRSNLPRVKALLAPPAAHGAQSASLAALAARAGEQLVSGGELREILRHAVDPSVSLEYAIVLSSVAVDQEWQTWLREYVNEVATNASAPTARVPIAMVAWCLLCRAGHPAARETGDAMGKRIASENINVYRLWELFELPVALQAQKHYIRHCTDPSFALTVAVSLLCGGFDPFLTVVQWAYQGNSVTYQFSRRPQPVARENLTDGQRAVLEALASASAAFAISTNVWKVWGLPDSAEKLRVWLSEQPA